MATDNLALIDEFCDSLWLEDGLSKNTLEAYRRDMRLFATWLEKKRPDVGGLAAVAAHDIQGVPRHARIVHDACTGLTLKERLGKEPDEIIAVDEAALGIEEEAAVIVAIPGKPEIRACLAHGLGGHGLILLEHGIGDAVRKGPIRVMMQFHELKWQMRLELIDDEPRPAVAGVYDDFESAQAGAIDVA